MHKKINNLIITSVLFSFIMLSAIPAVLGKAEPVMTREEMLEQIKEDAGGSDDILKQVPELKKSKGADGKDIYIYSDGKKEVNIENLDDAGLEKLLNKVSTQANAYWAAELAQQMENIRTAQMASSTQQQTPRPPSQPPSRPPSQPPRR